MLSEKTDSIFFWKTGKKTMNKETRELLEQIEKLRSILAFQEAETFKCYDWLDQEEFDDGEITRVKCSNSVNYKSKPNKQEFPSNGSCELFGAGAFSSESAWDLAHKMEQIEMLSETHERQSEALDEYHQWLQVRERILEKVSQELLKILNQLETQIMEKGVKNEEAISAN